MAGTAPAAARSCGVQGLGCRPRGVLHDAQHAEATRLRRQETMDAVRGDDCERARFSEALMAVLLRLDAVPRYDRCPTASRWAKMVRQWVRTLSSAGELVCSECTGRYCALCCVYVSQLAGCCGMLRAATLSRTHPSGAWRPAAKVQQERTVPSVHVADSRSPPRLQPD